MFMVRLGSICPHSPRCLPHTLPKVEADLRNSLSPMPKLTSNLQCDSVEVRPAATLLQRQFVHPTTATRSDLAVVQTSFPYPLSVPTIQPIAHCPSLPLRPSCTVCRKAGLSDLKVPDHMPAGIYVSIEREETKRGSQLSERSRQTFGESSTLFSSSRKRILPHAYA
ncbi:hypothetical protein EDD22DRAFT_231986 [Suillus occidentalis]|nr:hypothetical protein EDD22DRAFT_231986 [Suillus occidentalis]